VQESMVAREVVGWVRDPSLFKHTPVLAVSSRRGTGVVPAFTAVTLKAASIFRTLVPFLGAERAGHRRWLRFIPSGMLPFICFF